MLWRMRTTIRLEDELLRRAKRVAAERHLTLTQVISDALRAALAPRAAQRRKPFRFPTFRGTGVRPGVKINSSAELLGIMEGRGPSGR